MPVEGTAIKAKDLGVDIDDEFTVTAAPTSDLTQGIDLTQALRKIKIDDNVNKIDFSIMEDFTILIGLVVFGIMESWEVVKYQC